MEDTNKIEIIKQHIRKYPDFPKPGILFRDVFSVLTEPQIFGLLRDVMVNYINSIQPSVDCIAAVESRGFLFGPLLSLELGLPFVPIRKKGKLPGKVRTLTYDLEYGQDSLELQEDSIKANKRVIIIDDLIATGGSLAAACNLIEEIGAKVVCCLVVIELQDLKGINNLHVPIHSIIKY